MLRAAFDWGQRFTERVGLIRMCLAISLGVPLFYLILVAYVYG